MMSSDRYLRHNLIDWFSQDSLARTRVVVIGAGAVGNEVVKNLALLGVGEISVFDFDLIEEHNLTRSVLFRDADVGQSKALVAALRARELDPNIDVSAVVGDFWDHLSLMDLSSFDVVFCCVDNFEARIRCNTMCRIANVDLVNVGIDSRFALVERFPFGQDGDCSCYECNLPPSVYQRISERYSCGHLKKLSFIERKVPTTIITSSLAASFAVSVGLRLGPEGQRQSTRYYIDTIAGHLTRTELGRAEFCPCCSRFGDNIDVVTCRPMIGGWPQELGERTVTFSDPILAAYRVGSVVTPIFERASNFDSEYPATLRPDAGEVDLEVRDQFTVGELASRFSDRPIPAKFALVSGAPPTIFEFRKETE